MSGKGVSELPALYSLRKAGIILQAVGQEDLAAGSQLFEKDNGASGADEIQGRGDTRGPCTYDSCVIDFHIRKPWNR